MTFQKTINIILCAISLALGVAVIVILMLGELDVNHAIVMLGIGMACLGIRALRIK